MLSALPVFYSYLVLQGWLDSDVYIFGLNFLLVFIIYF